MKNEMIGEVLKNHRQKNNYSIRDVQKLLKDQYIIVAEKTIYSWESGRSQPDADTLLILCNIYGINDVLAEFGYSDKEKTSFTSLEERLIIKYRERSELHHIINILLDI